jgi:hypothetical protein
LLIISSEVNLFSLKCQFFMLFWLEVQAKLSLALE